MFHNILNVSHSVGCGLVLKASRYLQERWEEAVKPPPVGGVEAESTSGRLRDRL